MDELLFACRDTFPILLGPLFQGLLSSVMHPMRIAGQSRGEMLMSRCLGQGGKEFSLNWEELGMQRREGDADSCNGARAPSGLGFKT